MKVKPKKYLGQHFLTDLNVAKKIADSLQLNTYKKVLEIGPGTGVLTRFLLEKEFETHVIEIDTESVIYLNENFPDLKDKILAADFLKIKLSDFFKEPIAIIGNFPYNISSQIIFKTLENKELIPEFAGMFQKEVALRITANHGSKTYGVISVLTQAFYDVEYLFTVPPHVFNPPPKVESGVIRLTRKMNFELIIEESFFRNIVKTAFNQRRKTMRNSLKSFNLSDKLREDAIFALRPEQLSVQEFINMTKKIAKDIKSNEENRLIN
jgi:16S rRNA (adenine1518-N6/adenine1519-N6)-dimethyltransferase